MKALSLLCSLLIGAAAFAAERDESVSVDKKGVILKGYDAVAYFTQDKAVKGKKEFSAEHNGATYLFSSSANRDTFKADPDKYAPQYGGYCAYGAALGKKFPVNGKAFEIVDGRLYVNLDKGIAKKWSKDKQGYIKKANEEWPRIKNIPAKKL